MEKTFDSLMNVMVADLYVFYTKLHHYHWYVKGPSFFVLHEKFEELYNEVNELYDSVAERFIILGKKPASSLKSYLELTTLTETNATETTNMIKEVVSDLTHLANKFIEIRVVSQDLEDEPTADLAIGAISSFEKHIWMFSSLLK